MRVAILGTKGVPGNHGVEVVVDSLLPYLAEMGAKITVYGYNSYTCDMSDYKKANVVTVRGSNKKNFEMISHMWLSSIKTRINDFDIIHIHSTDPCLLAWLPKGHCGVIATSHGQAYLRGKWGIASRIMSKTAERFFSSIPDIVTSVSSTLRDYYEYKYNKQIVYIPNGIESHPTPPLYHLKKFGLSSFEFIFCCAGRIEKTKGLHTLLDAYERLDLHIPLVIAGGGRGSDPQYFKALKKRNVKGVRFVGFITGDDLDSLYAYSKLFVFPSEYEAMSMALLEGLSFGSPTIYSDIPENNSVAHGIGIPFRSKSSNSLSMKIKWAMENYTVAKQYGEKAKRIIRLNHDWKTISEQYYHLYETLYNNRCST